MPDEAQSLDAFQPLSSPRGKQRQGIDMSARLGAVMRKLRRARRVSQEALAEQAGIDRTTVGVIERGESRATLEIVQEIAQAFDMTFLELMTLAANEPKPKKRRAARRAKRAKKKAETSSAPS